MAEAHPPKRTEKLQLMLDDLEMAAIDDWRFANRMPSRAAAIRELIRLGLETAPMLEETPVDKASTDFRIVDPDQAKDG
ncbi:MAG: hypothetical protein ACMVY4_17680 [Minwuia sp.]|uniref:hypothetical protein n=1 Tax=Minwuia sp. TaxID=2493630 RepID=UPI003A841823